MVSCSHRNGSFEIERMVRAKEEARISNCVEQFLSDERLAMAKGILVALSLEIQHNS